MSVATTIGVHVELADLLAKVNDLQAAHERPPRRFMANLLWTLRYISPFFCGGPMPEPEQESPQASSQAADPIAALEINKLAPGVAAALVLSWLNSGGWTPSGILAACVRSSNWFKGNGELLRDQVHLNIAACNEHAKCREALHTVDADTSGLTPLVKAMLTLVQNHPGLHLRSSFAAILTELLRIYVRQSPRRRSRAI